MRLRGGDLDTGNGSGDNGGGGGGGEDDRYLVELTPFNCFVH